MVPGHRHIQIFHSSEIVLCHHSLTTHQHILVNVGSCCAQYGGLLILCRYSHSPTHEENCKLRIYKDIPPII